MSRVRDKNGNVIELGGEDLEKALRSGEYVPDGPAPTIVTDSGGRQAYDPSVLQEGLHGADFTPVGPEDSIAQRADEFYEDKYGGFEGGAAALGAGAARSLTFGGSDVLLDQLGYGEDLQHLQEVNPGLTSIGEVGGAIVPGVFSGGSGTLARLLAKTPAGALSKATGAMGGLKGSIAGGAIEGAAFGAGQGVSALAIDNEPLTAEAVWSEVGMGAIYGASAGAVLGGAAHGLQQTAKFLKGKMDARAAREAAEAVDHAAIRAEEISKLGYKTQGVTKSLSDATDDLIDTAARVGQGSDIVGSPKVLRQWAGEGHEARVTAFNELHARATAAGISQRTLGPIKDKIHQSLKLARTQIDPKGLRMSSANYDGVRKSLNRADQGLAELSKRIDKKLKITETYKPIAQRLDDLDDKFHAITGSGGKAPRMSAYTGVRPVITPRTSDPELLKDLAELQASRKAFRETWGLKNDDVINETVWKRFENFDPERARAAVQARDAFYSNLNKVAGRLPTAEFKTAVDLGTKEFKATIKEFAPPGEPGTEASELMKSLGMFEASNHVPEMDGPVDDALRWYLKGKAASGVFKMGSARGRTPWQVNAASNAARQGVYRKMPPSDSFLGGAAKGAAASMAGSAVRAVAMGGTQMAQATGKAIARIEMAMEKLARKAARVSRRSVPGVATVLSNASFGDSEEGKKDSTALFKRRSGELAQAMADPLSTQQRIHDNLADIRAVHPMVADHMEIQAMKTLGFLYDKMPKDPGTIMSLGRSRWVPDELAVAKWANYVRAAADPTSVIEDAADGTLNPQGAEVLRVLYPATFAEVQRRLWERMPELQENSSYDQRVRLSILFAVPLESTMDPKMKRFIAQRFADENAEQATPMDASGMKPEQPTQAQTIIAPGLV